jgi:hypothetical protein
VAALQLLPASLLSYGPTTEDRLPEHGIRRVEVPWAKEGSRFTLLYRIHTNISFNTAQTLINNESSIFLAG